MYYWIINPKNTRTVITNTCDGAETLYI